MAAYRLTVRQAKFKDLVISGVPASEAYGKAGYAVMNMSAASIHTEASRLMKHPQILPLIQEGEMKAAERAITLACILYRKRNRRL